MIPKEKISEAVEEALSTDLELVEGARLEGGKRTPDDLLGIVRSTVSSIADILS